MSSPPPPPPARAKTEALSLRIDPKTKFILEFAARVRGQSITTVVERAIRDSADKIVLSSADGQVERNWRDFWSTEDGVRLLRLLADPNYPSNYDEDEIREFTKTHWPFFYTETSGSIPLRAYVEILWPNIQSYLETWRSERHSNYWAAGEAMKADILKAKVQPPEWPKPAGKKTVTGPRESFSQDLDDEIPF